MRIAFTSTRKGITHRQARVVKSVLRICEKSSTGVGLAIHGGCKGGDQSFHEMCGRFDIKRRVRPSNLREWQAEYTDAEEIYAPAPPLERNKDIVKDGTFLLACPDSKQERLRSGTWSTVREARRRKKPVVIVFPDGGVQVERAELL